MIPAYSPGLPVILKNLNTMLVKYENEQEIRSLYSSSSPKHLIHLIICLENKPRPQALLLRLILLCYVPFTFKNLGYEILQILPVLFKNIDGNTKFPSTSDISQMLSTLNRSILL